MDGYELERLSADIVGLMDAIGLPTAVLVGSSSGGYVAQRFASDHPERAIGLVSIGSPRSLRERPAILDELDDVDDPLPPDFVRAFLVATCSQAVPEQLLDEMIGESMKVLARVWRAALHGLLAAEPPTEAGEIPAPRLLIWGDRDAFLPSAAPAILKLATPPPHLG